MLARRPKPTVLILESDPGERAALIEACLADGFDVLAAPNAVEARTTLERERPSVVIAELDASDGGMFLLRLAQTLETPPRYIGKTGRGNVHQAVEAMQLGAMTVIQSPVDRAVLSKHLARAVELPKDAAANLWVAERKEPERSIDRASRLMRGRSASLERAYQLIARVAPTDTHVLVTGESGVGKELIAHEIHRNSKRAQGPLVTVNCAAIPEALLESELFGHAKGAFTSAVAARQGRFRQAEGGTIFLDEIGEMKLDLQAKLLRVLQEREITPVGGNQTIKGDFRVVAATNQNLEALVEAGTFRTDLYYRLSVFPVQVAALRERLDDVPILVEHFIEEFRGSGVAEVDGISPEAMAELARYPWPGNVRELRNVVERMAIMRGAGRIELEDLPERIAAVRAAPVPARVEAPRSEIPDEGIDLRAELIDFETRLIRQALTQTGGNRNQAARLLRINRTTLVEKIKRLALE